MTINIMQTMQPLKKLISRLWRHIGSRRRGQFLLLLVLMIFASFAEIVSIGAVLPFLGALTVPDRIFAHQVAQPFIQMLEIKSAGQLLLPLTIIFCLAALVAGSLRVLLLWLSLRLSFTVGADLSNGIYRRTLYQPYAVHIARNSSEVINGISTKVGEVIFYVLMPALNLISASVIFVALLSVFLFIIPRIALVAFACFGLLYLFLIKLARNRLKNDSQHIARESANVIKSLQEGLGGIRDILIDGSQEVFCTNYRNADQTLRRAQGSNQFISYSPRYVMEVLAMLMIAVLAYVLSSQPGGIATAIPILAAIALGMQRMLPVLQQVYGSWSLIQGAQASLQGALALLEQPLPVHIEPTHIKPLSFLHQITLKQVSFSYASDLPPVLKDIDLSISKGSRVGFIGATGSGKSTLLDIIMGLLQPTKGTLCVDGKQIDVENLRSWQSHIAHVPQNVFLADTNVKENIAFGVPKDKVDYERVKQAARQAQIADVIEAWPLQYQTLVGERGIQLSGGQRQRIGIARALYKCADVIVFDEATSALDGYTEQAVMQSIEALSKDLTILIIAHRVSTLSKCTQIVEIDNGRIQKIITHE